MRRVLFSYLIAGLVWTADSRLPECDQLGTLLYEDLGCKAFYDMGNTCPSKFSCPPFDSDGQMCLFRGRKYNVDEEIQESLIMENCFYDCRCVNPSGYDKYKCSIRNCTEWSQRYNTTTCYKQYVVDQCCAIGTICPGTGREIHECEFEGTRYREGEVFFPSNSCSKCVCRKGFRGIIEEPFCRRTLCATQIVNYEELEHFCAPLYLPSPGETALCCPNDWVCHSENDTIINISPHADPNKKLFCNFGTQLVRFGEGLVKSFEYFGADLRVTCECIVPPLLTCKA